MKDKSKRLTVVNTDKKKADENASHILQQKPASALNAAGFNPALYLLKSVWDSVFEIKTDVSGQKYLFGKLPMVTQYGVTMYGDNDELNVSDIYEGLPIDNVTLYWDKGVLKAKGGEGGGGVADSIAWVNVCGKPSWVTDTKPIYNYSEIKNTPDLSVFVTSSALNNTLADYATLTYLTGELKKYVTIKDDQDIVGVKNFLNGIKISNMPIRKLQDDVIYIDANLVVRGGVTMYSDNEVDIPSIKDEIGFAGYNGSVGLASFDSSQFVISANGTVSIKGGSAGLDTAQLKDYLDSNKYTTETWVKEQGYASASSLSSLQNRVNDFLEGSDTDTIINKWKELELFLEGLTESDNLAEILTSKASLDYVNSTFVTRAGNEDVTGLHNFVNGLKIGGMKLSKSQEGVVYLDGNLVVRGGVTMYALDEVTVDSIIDSLPLASTSQYGIAKFNPSNFVINEDGFVTIIGGSSGLDIEELAEYLTTNKYATQGWVEGKGYITSSVLNGYATQSWVTNQKYITGITSAMVVSALGFTPYNSANFTKTNIKSTLGISDWALASAKPSYTTSEVTEGSRLYFTNQRAIDALASTLANYVTLGTKQTITGEKNFTGGLRVNNSPSIYYDATNKYWKLEGDLLVTGGVTMYGTDEGDLPSIIDSLPIASTSSAGIASFDSTYFSVNASGKVTLTSAPSMVSILGALQDVRYDVSGTTNEDVFLFKQGGTSEWTTKKLSDIGGGGSIQQPLRWIGYDSGMWDGTSDGLIVIPTSLKNPNALTFTGAVSATYDGSSAVTVNVPTAGGNIDLSGYLKKSGGAMTGQFSIMAVNSTSGPNIYYTGVTGTAFGRIGFAGVDMPYIWKADATGGYDILHSGNYSSYALPLSGGTLTNSLAPQLELIGNSTDAYVIYTTTHDSSKSAHSGVVKFSDLGVCASFGIGERIIFPFAGGMYYRTGYNGSNYRFLHEGNYSSFALPKTGGELSGNITWSKGYSFNIGTPEKPTSWINANAITGGNDGYLYLCAGKSENKIVFGLGTIDTGITRWGAFTSAGLGILTDSPSYTLHVNGTGYFSNKSTSIKINRQSTGGSAPHITYCLDDVPIGDIGVLNNSPAFFSYSTNKWESIALLSSNVASATKLQTARTIWGQSFNGTANVSGNIKGSYFTIGDRDKAYIELLAGSNYGYVQISSDGSMAIGPNLSSSVIVTQAGNVGIGKTSHAYKLDVNGDIYTTTGIKSPKFNLVTVDGIASYLQILAYNTSWAFQCNETYAFIGQAQARSLKINSSGHAISPVETDGRYSKFEMSGLQLFMPTSGGWTMGLSSRNSAGTEVNAIIKGYGNGQNIEKIYIGGGHTTSWMEINTSKNLLVKGGITMYSDIRKKTKLKDVELSLSQIANAPLIQHYYNSDQDKTTHVGSIAQYWAGLNDWFCKLDNEGYYTMEIQNCALASAISIARHLEKYESKTDKKIRMLKKRIQELEDKLEKLEGGNYVS